MLWGSAVGSGRVSSDRILVPRQTSWGHCMTERQNFTVIWSEWARATGSTTANSKAGASLVTTGIS